MYPGQKILGRPDEDLILPPSLLNTNHPYWPKHKNEAKEGILHTSLDSGNSSNTEDIFANSLCGGQVNRGKESPNATCCTTFNLNGFGALHQDSSSTQDESSFQSQTRSD